MRIICFTFLKFSGHIATFPLTQVGLQNSLLWDSYMRIAL